MIIYNLDDKYRYDIQSICLIFFPRETFKNNDNGDRKIILNFDEKGVSATLEADGGTLTKTACFSDFVTDSFRAAIKMAVYDLLCEYTGQKSSWGTLTSIKPALTLKSYIDRFGDKSFEYMKDIFKIGDRKLDLCKQVLAGRKNAVEKLQENDACMYVSIPFCPSRCSYCSFVSSVTGSESALIDDYIGFVVDDIKKAKSEIEETGKKIKAVYIGGGTPSILNTDNLRRLLKTIKTEITESNDVLEYTFEAGRPDTITKDKLDVLAEFGISRISINPQTLNEEILCNVNRKHTIRQFYDAFEMAEKYDFSVNVDLICGLPGDDCDGFIDSVKGIVSIAPANITVHTLYIKRASDFGKLDNVSRMRKISGDIDIETILDKSRNILNNSGYFPYYLYRQKNTVGNGENVGYSLKGKECLYNVWMMDDLTSIYGIGAGAVSKMVKGNLITRKPNLKLPLEYIKSKKAGLL